MAKDGITRTLSSFVKDDAGFVSRDSILKVGGSSFIFSSLLLGLPSNGEAYESHTDLSGDATHVNCLTHDPSGCSPLGHHNEEGHIDHSSNCY